MGKYFGFILLFIVSSCCGLHTEITYQYRDIIISRIDECGRSNFYFKKGTQDCENIVWAEYSGINDGFSGYLQFDSNYKVTLLIKDGYFQGQNVSESGLSFRYIKYPEKLSASDTLYFISSAPENEVERNQNSITKIKTNYKIDKNEWW